MLKKFGKKAGKGLFKKGMEAAMTGELNLDVDIEIDGSDMIEAVGDVVTSKEARNLAKGVGGKLAKRLGGGYKSTESLDDALGM